MNVVLKSLSLLKCDLDRYQNLPIEQIVEKFFDGITDIWKNQRKLDLDFCKL